MQQDKLDDRAKEVIGGASIAELNRQFIVNGNMLVHPSHNAGKDYIIIRPVHNMKAAAPETEPGQRQVYLAIPELPISHAWGDKIPYPLEVNNHVCYKAPKTALHKLAYKSSEDSVLGHYYIFVSVWAEREFTKGNVTKMREGVLTRERG